MVFENPLVFLVKHYKKIYIVLIGVLLLSLTYTIKALGLFNSYVENGGWYLSDINLINEYLPPAYILTLIAAMFFIIILIYIMKKGNSKTKQYILSLLAMIYSLIILIEVHSTLASAKNFVLSSTIEWNRYLLLFSIIFQVWSIMFFIVKMLGLNLKTIEFDVDDHVDFVGEKELEFTVSFDSNNVKENASNKMFYLSGFFKENKNKFVALIIILIAFGSYSMFSSYQEKNNQFHSYYYNDVNITLNKTYKTAFDANGVKADEDGFYYLILDINMETEANGKRLSYEDFVLSFGSNEYNPIYSNSFSDLGIVYNKNTLIANENNNYILIFTVNENAAKAKLSINGSESLKIDVIDLDQIQNKEVYDENGNIEFIDPVLVDNYFKLIDFSFVNYYTENIEVCTTYCLIRQKYYYADILNNYTFLNFVFDANLTLAEINNIFNSFYVRTKNDVEDKYTYFLISLQNDASDFDKNIAYFNISNEVNLFEYIELVFELRGISYTYKLKG